jgi:hypothetical protein
MSSCFYDMRGVMAGIDEHIFWKLVKGAGWPGILVGVPSKTKHLVMTGHNSPNNGKHTTTVTSEGNQMLKKDFNNEYFGHIPLTPNLASVLGVAWLAGVVVRSKTQPFMSMPSVTGQGAPLACCVVSMIGANVNCGGYGVVVNPNTVVTNPSLADFARALLGLAVNKAIDKAVDKVIGLVFPELELPMGGDKVPNPIAEILKWLFDEQVKKKYIDPEVDSAIERFVDGL